MNSSNTQKTSARIRLSRSPPSSIQIATSRAFTRGVFNNSKVGSDLGSPSRIANHASLHQKHSTNPKRQMPRKLQEQKSLRALMHATNNFKKSPRNSPQMRFQVAEDPDEEYFTATTMQASEVCQSPAMTGFQKFKGQQPPTSHNQISR